MWPCSKWVRTSAARAMSPILLGLAVMCWRVRQRWLSRADPRSPRQRRARWMAPAGAGVDSEVLGAGGLFDGNQDADAGAVVAEVSKGGQVAEITSVPQGEHGRPAFSSPLVGPTPSVWPTGHTRSPGFDRDRPIFSGSDARGPGAAWFDWEGQHKQCAQARGRLWCRPDTASTLTACLDEFLAGAQRPALGQRSLRGSHAVPPYVLAAAAKGGMPSPVTCPGAGCRALPEPFTSRTARGPHCVTPGWVQSRGACHVSGAKLARMAAVTW